MCIRSKLSFLFAHSVRVLILGAAGGGVGRGVCGDVLHRLQSGRLGRPRWKGQIHAQVGG